MERLVCHDEDFSSDSAGSLGLCVCLASKFASKYKIAYLKEMLN